jgi:magnesium transporter
MARFLKKRDRGIGLSPASLVFIGEEKMARPRLRVIDFTLDRLEERDIESLDDAARYRDTGSVTWINIDGLQDLALMGRVRETFGLHPLMMEDILNTGQRPKLDDFDDYLFVALKMLRYDAAEERVTGEQLSLVMGQGLVLTFQERTGDVFDPVRERIRNGKGRVRGAGADYLTYALLDTVVENYISTIEILGERIEEVEDAVLDDPGPEIVERIGDFKRETNYFRKVVRPAREAIIQLAKLDSDLIDDATTPFLKDLQDLATQASEAVDTYREMLSDQMTLYHSMVSNRMNEIMKVLTIFAAIFIPLTFIAGIYGTNFDHLPELHFRYSYLIFWVVIIVVAGIMLRYFRRKGWL